MVALGLSCSIQDLLVVAWEHLGHVGSSSLIRSGTQVFYTGSMVREVPSFLKVY